ncbi:HipA domain-containing protein [Vibrio mediterranei]|uniref:type II toxin-antitoxin system HipA family toxin n=1 Tax=Vibrio mediterranei TaxID=689 RepID=UPI0038CE3E1F
MKLDLAPDIYIENITISKAKAHELLRDGSVYQLSVAGGKNGLLKCYVQKTLDSHRDPRRAEHHIRYAIMRNLPIVLKSAGMVQTAQMHLFGTSEKLDAVDSQLFEQTHSLETSRTHLHVLSQRDKGKHTLGYTDEAGLHHALVNLNVDLATKQDLKLLIANQTDNAVYQYMPKTSFRYFDSLQSSHNYKVVQSALADLYRQVPTPLSYLVSYPKGMYSSDKGLESILCLYTRHCRTHNTVDQLQEDIETQMVHLLRSPRLSNHQLAIQGLNRLIQYCQVNTQELDQKLKNEVNYITNSTRAFSLRHYEQTLSNFVVVERLGLMRVPTTSWTCYADLSFHRDFANATFESLLPEIDHKSPSKNPLSRINVMSSMIANVTFQEVPTAEVFRSLASTKSSHILDDEHKYRLSSNPLNIIPAASFHTTTISDRPLFSGFFEGIPNYDKKRFREHMRNLMFSEFAAKLSGAQFKLPVTLSLDDNNTLHLQRQTGNLPFTHIAKFPTPGYDNITLAEWLPLTLLKKAGLSVAKNQLVSYETDHSPYEEAGKRIEDNEMSLSDTASTETDDHEDLFEELQLMFDKAHQVNELKSEHKNCPPFLISERFDIPYSKAGSNKRILSLDIGALLKLPSSSKYTPSMESVAEVIRTMIPQRDRISIAKDLYKQIIASVLLHNNDLHTKNITILAMEDTKTGDMRYQVSPIYDVIITPLVRPNALAHEVYHQALTINGELCPTRDEVIAFANEHLAIPLDEAKDMFYSLSNDLLSAVQAMQRELPKEFASRAKWADTIKTGLALVERNIKHIDRHGTTYGSDMIKRVNPLPSHTV